jgi:hypothetical protein
MPKSVIAFRCLIISPNDVTEERHAAREVVDRFNGLVGEELGIRFDPVMWELHGVPDMSGAPQAVINVQLVDSCDLGVAIFWSKLGTPTAEHESGSVEEIDRLIQSGRRVLVYLKNAPIPHTNLNLPELTRLSTKLNDYRQSGLLGTFADVATFRERFSMHLTAFATQLRGQAMGQSQPIPSFGTATAPMPDFRVAVSAYWALQEGRKTTFLHASCENHSPTPVFYSSFSLTLANDRNFAIMKDFYGLPLTPFKLEPGDSRVVCVRKNDLQEMVKSAAVTGAYMTDKIGRNFHADPNEVVAAVQRVLEMEED